jgi:hypothetical protein
MVREIAVLLPEDMYRAIERIAQEKQVPKGVLVRMILAEYLSLQPQRLPASPLPLGAKGLEHMGEDWGDEPQPFMKEKAGGGESG